MKCYSSKRDLIRANDSLRQEIEELHRQLDDARRGYFPQCQGQQCYGCANAIFSSVPYCYEVIACGKEIRCKDFIPATKIIRSVD